MTKLHVLRMRNPDDGSWEFDMDNPMPLCEAKKHAKTNRILGGILCQVWTQEEAEATASKEGKP